MPNKKYYEAHKEELKKYNAEYKKKNREKYNEYNRKYRLTHQEEVREYSKKWRQDNAEHLREVHKKYRADNIEEVRKWRRDWYYKNHEAATRHARITSTVNRAIRCGELERKPCEWCGAEPTEAHHCDYEKELDVMWLCPMCHAKWHKENIPKNSPYEKEWKG